jgi:chromosome transmission fidelity protein 4
MAWNSVGVITQFNREEDDSIEIEFHNASYHHTIHLKNQYGYTMADMSREVVVLASPGAKSLDEEERDELNPVLSSSLTSHSKLACILLNSLDNSKEWTVEMPRKEYVRCVCASRTLVACATSRRFLRIYHLAGTQREIISLPGAALCLAAYDNCVFVVYVRAAGVGYSIYYLDEGYMRRQAEHGELTLSGGDDAHTRLEWMGFSDEGNPYYYDSQGFLFAKALTVSARGVWSPFSNLRASLVHKSDHYWLVGVAERSGLVKTVHCKTAKYPNVLPRPTMTMMPIAMPFTDVDTEKTQLEQEYWKNKHFVMSMKNYDCLSGNCQKRIFLYTVYRTE